MGGGGGSGAISHSAYMEFAHKNWLNQSGLDLLQRSVVAVMNTALTAGFSPFAGALAYNPDVALSANGNSVAAVNVLVDAMSFTADYISAYNASTVIAADIGTLDTAALDITALDTAILNTDIIDVGALDTAILDTFVIDDSQVAADVAAFSAEQEDQLNNVVLPRFKIGMLNIGAVASSSFVLGESQLRAFKARDVAKYNGDLRSRLSLQAGEIRGRFMSERREIDARFKLQFQDITSKYKMQHKDKATEYIVQYNDFTRQFKMQYQELTQRYKMQFQDLTSRYKMQFAEITARHKLQRQSHIQAATSHMLNELMKRNELAIQLLTPALESNRTTIIAKTEQFHENMSILEHDRKWDLEVFQYGTAVLGGIGGGQFVPGKKSKSASALGGALSGAGSGAAIGSAILPGWGTLIGAGVGAIAGGLSGS